LFFVHIKNVYDLFLNPMWIIEFMIVQHVDSDFVFLSWFLVSDVQLRILKFIKNGKILIHSGVP